MPENINHLTLKAIVKRNTVVTVASKHISTTNFCFLFLPLQCGFRKGHGAENCLSRQLLCETFFSIVSFSNIAMFLE